MLDTPEAIKTKLMVAIKGAILKNTPEIPQYDIEISDQEPKLKPKAPQPPVIDETFLAALSEGIAQVIYEELSVMAEVHFPVPLQVVVGTNIGTAFGTGVIK